jgi:hypothetical protein
VIAPSLGGRAGGIERGDTAAEDAAIVAAVLAGSVGAIGIAALVGPALRAPRGSETPRQRPVRVAIALGLGLAAAAGFAMLTALDSSR